MLASKDNSFRYLVGLAKSKWLYQYMPGRARAMRSFYRSMLSNGDLCFDLGSHIGNRASVLASLGCRVIAVEPHPHLAIHLRKRFAKLDNVTVEECGVSNTPGEATLYCSPRHLTVSSLDKNWPESLGALRSHSIRFSEAHSVNTVTIDRLVQKHGMPRYCKIDIEGLDTAVIKTLSQPIEVVSFEHLPHLIEATIEAIAALRDLAAYRFNYFERESHRFCLACPVEGAELVSSLRRTARRKFSCDVFAFRQPLR